MSQTLHMLIVEDSKDDADLLLGTMRSGGYEPVCEVVDNSPAMRAALGRQDWDLITSDHAMPQFSAPAALALAKELRPNVPLIIVSGEIDLNLAVSLIKAGARDYVQKTELVRLVPVIDRVLRDTESHHAQQRMEKALQASETRYRRLFETAQDGILILDAETPDRRRKPVPGANLENSAWEKNYGKSAPSKIPRRVNLVSCNYREKGISAMRICLWKQAMGAPFRSSL